MDNHLINIDLPSQMDTFRNQANMPPDVDEYNLQDIEASFFALPSDSMESVPHNFQTGEISVTCVNTFHLIPQYSPNSSTYSRSDNSSNNEFSLESSIASGACNSVMSQVFPTTFSSSSAREYANPGQARLSEDDLKLQTFKHRSSKTFVPDSAKDDRYWQRRKQNNNASKKSRYVKRMKENQIVLRVAKLESENASIKEEMDFLRAENYRLIETLQRLNSTELCMHL